MSFLTYPSGLISTSIGSLGFDLASVMSLSKFASTLFRYLYGFLAGMA